MVIVNQIAVFVMGFALGMFVWQITNIIRDTRRLGQERSRAERRKEDRTA